MKFRFAWPGLIFLLLMLAVTGSRMALADDQKSQGSDHQQTQSSEGSDNRAGSGEDAGDGGYGGDGTDGGDGTKVTPHEVGESAEKEQEEARQAVAAGKAAPLTLLLKKLQTDYPGQILDVALARNLTKLVFVVKYIDTTGILKTVTLDALTLEVY